MIAGGVIILGRRSEPAKPEISLLELV